MPGLCVGGGMRPHDGPQRPAGERLADAGQFASLASAALPREAGRALQPCAFAFQKALSAYFELPENDQGWPRQPPTSFKSEA